MSVERGREDPFAGGLLGIPRCLCEELPKPRENLPAAPPDELHLISRWRVKDNVRGEGGEGPESLHVFIRIDRHEPPVQSRLGRLGQGLEPGGVAGFLMKEVKGSPYPCLRERRGAGGGVRDLHLDDPLGFDSADGGCGSHGWPEDDGLEVICAPPGGRQHPIRHTPGEGRHSLSRSSYVKLRRDRRDVVKTRPVKGEAPAPEVHHLARPKLPDNGRSLDSDARRVRRRGANDQAQGVFR